MRFAIQDHLFSASLVCWAWQTLLFQFVWASAPDTRPPVCPLLQRRFGHCNHRNLQTMARTLTKEGRKKGKGWVRMLSTVKSTVLHGKMSVRAVRPVWCSIVILICGHIYRFSVNLCWQNLAISMN